VIQLRYARYSGPRMILNAATRHNPELGITDITRREELEDGSSREAEPNRGDRQVVNSDRLGAMDPTPQGVDKMAPAHRRAAARKLRPRCA
jgi:hypothetical protein